MELKTLTPEQVELLIRRLEQEDLPLAVKRQLMAIFNASLSDTPLEDGIAALPKDRQLQIAESSIRIYVRTQQVIQRGAQLLETLPESTYNSSLQNEIDAQETSNEPPTA